LSAALRRRLAAVAALFLLALAPAFAGAQKPEPDGLWQGAMHGATPKTLHGATVLDDAALQQLLATHPILIDVGPADKKPDYLSASAIWLPVHHTIPGAVWLPGAGSGTSDPQFAEAFHARLAALAMPDQPVVVFCHPDCWGSWNAAKRLVGLGYAHVYWYPGGVEAWQTVHETAVVKPDPAWKPPAAKQQP
jgi:PQQ-dependent catabolism-associated CXXCW motif protein